MPVNWEKVYARLKSIFISQFLLISYVVAATIALAWPVPGKAVGSVQIFGNVRLIQTINIIIVFFISGLVLKTDELKAALRHRLGVIYGFIAVLGITPCLGFAYREIPLTPSAFAAGLTLTCAVPCTLGIGISLVRSCKGNEALALFLTVGTNILGIFTMPLWLKALFSGQPAFDLSIDIGAMLAKLVITVLVPSVLGKAVRELSKRAQQFTKDHRTFLGLFSTANLACIVWLVLSAAQEVLMEQQFVSVLYVVLLAFGQHCFYLVLNFAVVVCILRMPCLEAIATGIMSAQKSGPVSVTVISYITDDASTQGLMAIPAVIGQIGQVFIGSALVPFLAGWAERYNKEQATSASRLALVTAPEGGREEGPGGEGGSSEGKAVELSSGMLSSIKAHSSGADLEQGAEAATAAAVPGVRPREEQQPESLRKRPAVNAAMAGNDAYTSLSAGLC